MNTLVLTTLLLAGQVREFNVPEIVVEENSPIVFSVPVTEKEGWSSSDKIQLLDSSEEISSALKFVTRGNEYFAWAPPGEHFLRRSALYINWTKQDFDKQRIDIKIRVKGTTPPPIPNNPFPEGKFFLIVEEQSERNGLANAQQQIFSSSEVFDLLDNNGFTWRVLDCDTEFSKESVWEKPVKSSSDLGKFRLLISNGKKWTSVKLPNTITEVLNLIKEYN